MPKFSIHNGDCLDLLRQMPDNCIDSIVTDPPAGISFMSKNWDHDKGGRDQWIAWMAEVAKECLRVIKPGGHALVWAIPRTSHWTAMGWENAGWEVRERVAHIFGQGFPKSLSIGKAIDKLQGNEREVIDTRDVGHDITGGGSEWEGWGTALKPAVEDWWLFRKPLDGTVAANCLKHGVGGLNIDACRIGVEQISIHGYKGNSFSQSYKNDDTRPVLDEYRMATGRWPANAVLSHAPGCKCVGVKKVKNSSGSVSGNEPSHTGDENTACYGEFDRVGFNAYGDADGMEEVEAWECVEGCPIRLMDMQSGARSGCKPHLVHASEATRAANKEKGWGSVSVPQNKMAGYDDSGGASRFFANFKPDYDPFLYCAKANGRDRNEGLDKMEVGVGVDRNSHPT